jgi:serine/threonine protein kinase
MSRTCPECSVSYDEEIIHCPEDGNDLSKVEPDDPLIGRSIGSYRVVKPLGKGGMGAVYLAEHPMIGSRVAIKFLHPQYATDEKIVDRFLAEARAVNVIGHDNILKILDLSVTEDNRHYFVMEFLHGRALQDLVKPDVPVGLDVTGSILLQTCEALQAAHDHKIIHRDLKPDNIYLIVHKGRKNFVKVVDFGIAKVTDDQGESTGKTQTGMVMGTPAYMSPEQAGGMGNRIDARSDIYSLGCMMYQMATGKLPFPGSSFGEVLIGHLQLMPPEPRSLRPEISEEYQAIIMKCLAKSQDDRYQTMRELHDAVGACMDAEGITRELPIADPKEVELAQGPKSLTAPKTQARASKPTVARPRTAPGQQTRAAPAATQMLQPAPPPARSNTVVYVGIIAGVFVVLGTVGVLVWHQGQQAQRQEQIVADLAAKRDAEERRVADAARLEAERKHAEELKTAAAAPAEITIETTPPGATVDATWGGQKQSGVTPTKLYVPRNAAVHLQFSKEGFAPLGRDLVAEGPEQISIGLIVEAPKPKVVKAPSKAPVDKSKGDDALSVEF